MHVIRYSKILGKFALANWVCLGISIGNTKFAFVGDSTTLWQPGNGKRMKFLFAFKSQYPTAQIQHDLHILSVFL